MTTYLNHRRDRFNLAGGRQQAFPIQEKPSSCIRYPVNTYTNVTPSATANTKGAYSEFCSSTPEDSIINTLSFTTYGTTWSNYLVDIALGASGSESIIVENLFFSNIDSLWPLEDVHIPIFVPKGSRISVRAQSSGTSRNLYNGSIDLEFGGSRFYTNNYFTKVITLGAAYAGATDLTAIDPGSSANTYGAWYEFSSNLPFDCKGVLLMVSTLLNTSRTNDTNWFVQVGVGASGNEQPIIDDSGLYWKVETKFILPFYRFYHISIPKGSRVAIRCRSNVTGHPARLTSLGLYCFGM